MTDRMSDGQWWTDWGFISNVKSDRMTGQFPYIYSTNYRGEKVGCESLDTFREFYLERGKLIPWLAIFANHD